jgi:hypothetical protein
MWCNWVPCLWVRQPSTKLHGDNCTFFNSLYLEGLVLYFDIRKSSTRWPPCSSSVWAKIWILASSKALQRPWKLLSCHSWLPYFSFEIGESYWHYDNSYENKGEILTIGINIMLKEKFAQSLGLLWKSASGQIKKKRNIKIYSQCTVMTTLWIFPVLFTALAFGFMRAERLIFKTSSLI